MIRIIEKPDCCGCGACMQICPRHCISMKEDPEGFLYPSIDENACSDCGLCEKICPTLNHPARTAALKVWAAKNNDLQIRTESSSGGLFTLFARQTIEKGGAVFGARFDKNWEVFHDWTGTMDGLAMFRGSKYLQSRTGNAFSEVKSLLRQGKEVLFSGTPCQVKALKLFLGKEYDNLTTVDFICHGVPSPGVWRKYIASLSDGDAGRITGINFRDKSSGWKEYSMRIDGNHPGGDGDMVILSERHFMNLYMQMFLSDIILRPSCYHCKAKGGKSGSDITIADFWGIQDICPDFDDDRGTSLVIINTEKGLRFNLDTASLIPAGLTEATAYNGGFFEERHVPASREDFFRKFNEDKDILKLMRHTVRPSVWDKIKNRLRRLMRRLK